MSFAYMPLFTGDYLRDTRHLSPLRHGVFFLALMYCWDSKSPMPLDEQECAGICNCRSADEVDAMRYVLERYFVKLDDGHYNKRMSEEVAKAERQSSAYRDAGLKSAEVRRAKARLGMATKVEAKLNQGSTEVKPRLVSPTPTPTSSPIKDKETITLSRDSARPSAEAPPDCPHLEILALWARTLPALPAHNPELWNGARADHLRARWRETAVLKKWPDKDTGIAYFQKLFWYIAQSKFLTGRAKPTRDGRPFFAELEWLVKPGNWAKVQEGKYHQDEAIA